MKNKCLLTILIAITSLVIGINGVRGIEIDPNATGSTGQSRNCAGGWCGSPIYYGLRVSLINTQNGSAVNNTKTIQIWPSSQASIQAAKNMNYTRLQAYNNVYIGGIGETQFATTTSGFETFVNNLDAERVKKILKALLIDSSNADQDVEQILLDSENYRLKFEPLVILWVHGSSVQGCSSATDENCGYVYGGTAKEIWSQKNIDGPVHSTTGAHTFLETICRFNGDLCTNKTSVSSIRSTFPFTHWQEFENMLSSLRIKTSITINSRTIKPLGGNSCGICTSLSCSPRGYLEILDSSNANCKRELEGLGVAYLSIRELLGSLTVIKTKNDGRTPVAGAKFKLYSGECPLTGVPTGSVKASFTTTYMPKRINGLPFGAYCLYEEDAPTAYYLGALDSDIRKETIIINAANVNSVITIKNKTECEYKLEVLKAANYNNNREVELIKLYNNLSGDFTELLNFQNPSCVSNRSSLSSTISCNSNYPKFILEGSQNISGFKKNDVSSYDFKYIDTDKYVFCKLEYNFASNKSTKGNVVKAGKLIWSNLTKEIFGETNHRMICYGYGNVINRNVEEKAENLGVELYLYNNKLSSSPDIIHDKLLTDDTYTPSTTTEVSGLAYGTSRIIKSEINASSNYYLPHQYAYYGTGERYLLDPLAATSNNAKFIGYGIWTLLSDTDGAHNNKINFDVNYTTDSTSYFKQAKCSYEVDDGIVVNGKLNLEYRTIDTDNPFPGSRARRRNVGANWCDGNNCTLTGNKIIAEYITGGHIGADYYTKPADSYKQSYKYKILLTPDTIKDIRTYNEAHSYDDWIIDATSSEYFFTKFNSAITIAP